MLFCLSYQNATANFQDKAGHEQASCRKEVTKVVQGERFSQADLVLSFANRFDLGFQCCPEERGRGVNYGLKREIP